MDTMSENIKTEVMGRILRIELNRQEKKNALSMDMYAGIGKAINEAEQDPNIRVILIHGQKDFCAGNDMGGFQSSNVEKGTNPLKDFSEGLIKTTKPIIAAVKGYSIGVGMTMLLHCDLVYAGTSAQFRTPFVNLAICPDMGSTYVLPRLVGHHLASEILLLCDFMTAEEAYRIGFVNKVFPDDILMEKVMEIANRLAEKPPGSVRLTKQLLKRHSVDIIMEQKGEEFKNLAKKVRSREAREVFKAFFEKRYPDFSKFI